MRYTTETMKFFFDARYIRTDFHDGISRYSTELAAALYRQSPDEVTYIIHDPLQLSLLPEGAPYIITSAPDVPQEPFIARHINRHHPDVVASPLQTMGGIGRTYKLILNQQDLTYYRHSAPPGYVRPWVRFLWRLYHLSYVPGRIVLNAADTVATVSQTSKQEIEAARLTRRPIVVVSNAARDLRPYLGTKVVTQSSSPANLVYMGSFTPYKNVETLIESLRFLPGKTLHLLSRITPERRRELEARIPEGASVIFHGGVSDETYAALLADDAIMVSASQSEGFGLPLAEALALGVPAVVSDIPSFREVAGDGALFVPATHPEAFADAIRSLDDVDTRIERIQRGKHHIASFSWDTSAAALLDAARNLL